MRWFLGLLILGLSTAFCFKGKNQIICFNPKFGNQDLIPEKNYFLSSINDSISVDVFRFYISDVCLLKNNKTVAKDKNRFHLIDISGNLKLSLNGNLTDFDAIRFNVGIDSITNSSGVKGGDLDPTKNMYWAWQSGYINFKLEGKSKVCKTRNNIFQYHIGGYNYPNNSLQTITIPNTNGHINFDIEKFFNGVELQTTNEIMSPGEKAMRVAKLYKSVFEQQ